MCMCKSVSKPYRTVFVQCHSGYMKPLFLVSLYTLLHKTSDFTAPNSTLVHLLQMTKWMFVSKVAKNTCTEQ